MLLGVVFGFVVKRRKYPHPENPDDLMPIEFKKNQWESKKEKWENFWEYVLIVGLGLELAVLPHSIKEFEVLRKSNLELQLKLQHRIVTKDQRDKFITFLKDAPKGEIVVTTVSSENETITYGWMIRSLLDEAGYRSGKHPILEFEPREQFVLLFSKQDAYVVFTIPDAFHPPDYAIWLRRGFEAVGIKTAATFWTDTNALPFEGAVLVTVKERN